MYVCVCTLKSLPLPLPVSRRANNGQDKQSLQTKFTSRLVAVPLSLLPHPTPPHPTSSFAYTLVSPVPPFPSSAAQQDKQFVASVSLQSAHNLVLHPPFANSS